MLATLFLSADLHAKHPLIPRLLKQETYTETYTTIVDFEDGGYLQVQLAISNIGPGSARGICRYLLVEPHSSEAIGETLADQTWHASKQPPTLKIGTCRMTSGATTTLDISTDERSLLVDIAKPIQAHPLPFHPLNVDEDASYNSEILVSWSDAHVLIAQGDQGQPHQRNGRGYIDHSRSTALPRQLARGWARFRALGGPCPLLFLARLPPRSDHPIRGYLWSTTTGEPLGLHGMQLHLPDIEKKRLGWRLPIEADPVRFVVTPKKHLYRHAPLEEHGWVARLIGSWVGKSVTHTYRAELHANPATGPLANCEKQPGILEVTHVLN